MYQYLFINYDMYHANVRYQQGKLGVGDIGTLYESYQL